MRRNLGWLFVVALFASALLAPSAGAKVRYPRLDLSFGSGGYLAPQGPLAAPAGEPSRLESLAAAPGGAVYATETVFVPGKCTYNSCPIRAFLGRVNSDGSRATTFGGSGRVEVAGGAVEQLSPAISDSQGRALVVSQRGSSITVHRYLSDGSVDASFGSAGVTTFDCGCAASGPHKLELAVDGQERIVVSVNTLSSSGAPPAEMLARLLPNGAIDSSFGSGGILQLGVVSAPLGIAFGSNGAIYNWGESCCQSSSPAYLHRVSAKGRIDSTFNAQADRTLANVGARGTLRYGMGELVVRSHGLLDFYGGDGLLRLRSNGTAETKFGRGGVTQLGWTVTAPTLVGNGKVLALGSSSEGVSLIRLQSSGKPDRSFGSEGARLIEGVSEEGDVGLARLNGRRAQVLDYGVSSGCRQICPAHPSLVRFRIGPKS